VDRSGVAVVTSEERNALELNRRADAIGNRLEVRKTTGKKVAVERGSGRVGV
jgi:hypothetical protein